MAPDVYDGRSAYGSRRDVGARGRSVQAPDDVADDVTDSVADDVTGSVAGTRRSVHVAGEK